MKIIGENLETHGGPDYLEENNKMPAIDFGDAYQSEFERRRAELLEYFLGELLDLYAVYDEIEPAQTLAITVEVVDQESTNQSFGFSDN